MNNTIKEGIKQCCQDILSRGKGEKKSQLLKGGLRDEESLGNGT